MYIYADNAGTTKMSPVAIDAMTKCMNEVFGTHPACILPDSVLQKCFRKQEKMLQKH